MNEDWKKERGISYFKQDETEKIISRFGESFYEKVLRDIVTYTEKWKLYDFEFVHSYSANCVLNAVLSFWKYSLKNR